MQTSEAGQVAPRKSGRVWMAVGLLTLALGAGAVGLWLQMKRAEPGSEMAVAAKQPLTEAAQGTEVAGQAAPPPGANASQRVPALGDSDEFMRRALSGLGEGGVFDAWLRGGDLARRMASLLMSMSEGEMPRALVAAFAPAGTFEVEADEEGRLFVTDETYGRYDALTQLLSSVDARRAAMAFNTVEPLLERAWREVAPPRLTLRQAASRAVAQLLAVPVPDAPVEVTERGAIYVYADPSLESLTAAQKQLLRLGPDNARAVQDKLREVRDAVGLPAAVR